MRLVFLLLFLSKTVIAQDINEVRQLYLDSGKDRQKTGLFVEYFSSNYYEQDLLFLAYHGTALTMLADLEKGKINKYKVFVSGRDKLESAINSDKKNIEMRYLRFAVQSNIPRILGYNNLEEDKVFLLENLQSILFLNNKELQEVIYNTLLSSNYLNDEEIITVKAFIKHKKNVN